MIVLEFEPSRLRQSLTMSFCFNGQSLQWRNKVEPNLNSFDNLTIDPSLATEGGGGIAKMAQQMLNTFSQKAVQKMNLSSFVRSLIDQLIYIAQKYICQHGRGQQGSGVMPGQTIKTIGFNTRLQIQRP
jgi:hypothetical protein